MLNRLLRRHAPPVRVPLVDLDAEVILARDARRFTRSASKMRVRVFVTKPWRLDRLSPGLGDTASGIPDAGAVLAAADRLHELERGRGRHAGFAGELPMLNVRALRLYGRALRRRERRLLRIHEGAGLFPSCPAIAEPIAPPRPTSRFIDRSGRVAWVDLRAECPTAHRAAEILSCEGVDGATDDEVDALLWSHEIDPAQVDERRADVLAIAAHERAGAARRGDPVSSRRMEESTP